MNARKLAQHEKDILENVEMLRGFVNGKMTVNEPIFTDQLLFLAAQLEMIKARLTLDYGD